MFHNQSRRRVARDTNMIAAARRQAAIRTAALLARIGNVALARATIAALPPGPGPIVIEVNETQRAVLL